MNVETLPLTESADHAGTQAHARAAHYLLVILFLVSGSAALIYQVCWQRLLFESVGVDIESVTIIVSTFMLGLGLGSLAGGQIVDRYPAKTLEMFALIELATAVFGAFSPSLIHAAGASVAYSSRAVAGAMNFGLLLIPTVLMGATLPILVAHVVRHYKNIGVSVGVLYFANTLGAALGAGVAGFVALYYVGLTHTIYIAVAINVLVSFTVWFNLRGKGA
jgi:predicted membrane-bound spermidine synthase